MMNKYEYEVNCAKFDIDPSTYEREFDLKGKRYRIVGINPRARTKPFICIDLKTNVLKPFGKEILDYKTIERRYEFDDSYIGAKFRYNNEFYEIVRCAKNIYDCPIIAIKISTGVEHEFGIWILKEAMKKVPIIEYDFSKEIRNEA